MPILRENEISDLLPMKEAVDRLVANSVYFPKALLDTWMSNGSIPLDMYEEENSLVVKASLPGIEPEDVKVEVRENVLTISAQTKQEVKNKKDEDGYFLNERSFGQIRRSVALPYEVKMDRANAEFENGVLTVTMPKVVTVKAKKIAVKSKAKNEAKTKGKAEAKSSTEAETEAKVE